jgi:hypothetical protein
VAVTAEESSLDVEPLAVESSLAVVESSLDAEPLAVVESLDAEPLAVVESSLDAVAAVVVVVFAFVAGTLARAGSSPSWTRSARTPKTATKLASAPAAKRRAEGPRRTRLIGGVGSWGMATASAAELNPP